MNQNNKVGHFNQYVKGTNIESGEVRYFKNARRAAHEIGCSHVMAIKVLRGEFKQTMGWRLQWVSRDAPECSDVKFPTNTRLRYDMMRRVLDERKENVKQVIGKMTAEIKKARMNPKLVDAMKSEFRKVVQYTIDGSFVQEFDNIHQAQQLTGLWNINLAIAGAIPDAGGYVWKFKHEI